MSFSLILTLQLLYQPYFWTFKSFINTALENRLSANSKGLCSLQFMQGVLHVNLWPQLYYPYSLTVSLFNTIFTFLHSTYKEFCGLQCHLDLGAWMSLHWSIAQKKRKPSNMDLILYTLEPTPSKSNFESIRQSLNEVILLVNISEGQEWVSAPRSSCSLGPKSFNTHL